MLGPTQAHQGIASKFVKAGGVVELLFDYRLALDHPFPAALEDAAGMCHCYPACAPLFPEARRAIFF